MRSDIKLVFSKLQLLLLLMFCQCYYYYLITFALHNPRELTASVHFVCFGHLCLLSRSQGHNGGHTEICAASGNAGLKLLALELAWSGPPTNRGSSYGSVRCWSCELPSELKSRAPAPEPLCRVWTAPGGSG